jgi:hypothetical protein
MRQAGSAKARRHSTQSSARPIDRLVLETGWVVQATICVFLTEPLAYAVLPAQSKKEPAFLHTFHSVREVNFRYLFAFYDVLLLVSDIAEHRHRAN